MFLLDEQKNPDHAHKALVAPRPKDGKNKGKDKIPGISPEYDEERAWLLKHLSEKDEGRQRENNATETPSTLAADESAASGEIECGCCFGEYSFVCQILNE